MSQYLGFIPQPSAVRSHFRLKPTTFLTKGHISECHSHPHKFILPTYIDVNQIHFPLLLYQKQSSFLVLAEFPIYFFSAQATELYKTVKDELKDYLKPLKTPEIPMQRCRDLPKDSSHNIRYIRKTKSGQQKLPIKDFSSCFIHKLY